MKRLYVRKASAGSGKTYQLALDFIKMTLGHRDASGQWRLNAPDAGNCHSHILAITFTNKATDEMKQRIVRQLAILARVPLMAGLKSDYESTLISEFGMDGDPDGAAKLQRAANRALRDLLFDYAEFNVSTIDAFFQSVLRSFAFEADLSGNYEVMLNSDALITNGIADTIKQAAESDDTDELRLWLESFMTTSLRNGKSFNLLHSQGDMRESLKEFIGSLTDECYQRHSDEIDGFIAGEGGNGSNPVKRLHDSLVKVPEKLKTELQTDAQLLKGHPDFDCAMKFVKDFVDAYAGGGSSESPGVFGKVNTGNVTALFLKNANPAADFSAGLVDFVGKVRKYLTAEEMLGQIHAFGLFGTITGNINRTKSESNTILLSDTNTLLRRIIGDSPSPFLYERTGLRLRHFLIDEFQDTSRLQWDNLRPLLVESVASGNDNLIIGDVKQCIYRFRNSDPKLLGRDINADPDLFDYVNELHQSVNYRSAKEIVAFNYMLFPLLGAATGCAASYPPETDAIRSNAPGGRVDIRALAPANFKDDAFDRMYTEMCRQLDPARGNYRPKDIAVLTDTNSNASEIIKYLMDRFMETPGLGHVQVMGDESLMLEASAAVRSVIAAMRRLDSRPVPTAWKANEYAKVSQGSFDRLAGEFEQRRAALGGGDPYAELSRLISEFDPSDEPEAQPRAINGSEALPTLVDRIIATLPDDLREADSVYLFALSDLAMEFCQSGTPSLHEFMKWWDQIGHKSCITSSPATDAIRVMTIHKAKGLEFDCVHIPLVEGNLGRETNIRWYDCGEGDDNLLRQLGVKDCPVPRFFPLKSSKRLVSTEFYPQYQSLLDESVVDDLNALYVAFTRPRRELTVSVKGRAQVLDKKTGKCKDGKTDPTNVDLLLVTALGAMRSSDGTWAWVDGAETTRIIAPSDDEPDCPEPVLMPPYSPGSGTLDRIMSELADEPK